LSDYTSWPTRCSTRWVSFLSSRELRQPAWATTRTARITNSTRMATSALDRALRCLADLPIHPGRLAPCGRAARRCGRNEGFAATRGGISDEAVAAADAMDRGVVPAGDARPGHRTAQEHRAGHAAHQENRDHHGPVKLQTHAGYSSQGYQARPAERGHSMSRSACASSDAGTVSSSAFAVLRLITSSNLVGCSTGRSAGRAPRRIRAT
jgi:hypothetical protein